MDEKTREQIKRDAIKYQEQRSAFYKAMFELTGLKSYGRLI